MLQQIALTIKPTMNCNMRCKHCFNGDTWKSSGMLSSDLATRFIEIASRDYQLLKITFHGGEPTLAGYDFYRKFYDFENELSRQRNTKFSNLFTTNGLALTEDLMDLLIANDTLINISFDGPFNEVLRQRTENVYRHIEKLKDKRARMRIFCTVSSVALGHLREIYVWFNNRSLDFKLFPIDPRGYAKENPQYLMSPKEFASEVADLYNYWLRDKHCRIRVYTFEEFVKLNRNVQFKSFWFNKEIALNPDGKIYPFGRPNDVNFCLGSVLETNSLLDCFRSCEYERMIKNLKDYHKNFCTSCRSKGVCNGVILCMSYMYESEIELLKHGCQRADHIFQRILEINESVFSSNNPYAEIVNPMIQDTVADVIQKSTKE